jgi:tetratricopeptide (TPR) repeat protein
MLRNLLRVIVVVFGSGFALPQTPSGPTAQDVIAGTLSDLRGRSEVTDQSRREDWSDPGTLYSFFGGPVARSPMALDIPLPARERPSAGTVSARRLRHRPPKAARQAYEKGIRNKDASKAAMELEKAIALDPDFGEAHADLGVAYSRQARYPEAAAEFRRAIDVIPGESLPYSNLAWVQFAMGQRAEAEMNARIAIRISPDNASAHLLIGCLLIEIPENRAEGLQHLEYAARTIPDAQRLLKAFGKK